MTSLSPAQMVQRMGNGINLGGFFEMQNHDCSAATVSPVLKAFADKGFKSVRIVVTWYPDSLNGACRLDDPVFMKNLDNAIWYSASLGMCVILNSHFENWIHDHYDGSQAIKDKFWGLWVKIVKRYQSISQHDLVFEVLNEPSHMLGGWDWNNCNDSVALDRCRSIIRTGFDGIRSVSKDRVIMLPVNGMQSICQCQQVYGSVQNIPMCGADQYLMIAVHAYVPWSSFCGENATNDFYLKQNDPYHAMWVDIDNLLSGLCNWKNSLNYPSLALALTETGVGDANNSGRRNTDIVRSYYRMMADACRRRGIAPMAWNDCSKTSWFGMSTLAQETNGQVQWLYGLADAFIGR